MNREKSAQLDLLELSESNSIGTIEKWAYSRGLFRLIGIDEAGRGPLAGPVVACAVALPPHMEIQGLNDSKQLSEKQRQYLLGQILDVALAFGIGIVKPQIIDDINILQATLLAMRKALRRAILHFQPDCVLIDGRDIISGENHLFQKAVIRGDCLSANIAAASILAKVTRDRIMTRMHEKYPAYNFMKNKGYGTKDHREKLMEIGPCPLHRKSFLKKILKNSAR